MSFKKDDSIIRNPVIPREVFMALGLDPEGEYTVLEALVVEGLEGIRLTPVEGALADYYPSRLFIKKTLH